MMRVIKSSVLLLLLSLCFAMPSAFAGGSLWNINNSPTILTLSYFDLRDRETMVQVTNTSSDTAATIHVQIFADLNNCADRNFTDSLTPNETHVYDIRNLVRANNGNPVNFQIPDGSHGFVIISASDGTAPQSLIIGNFRIIDNSGYEYRVNSAGGEQPPMVNYELVGRFSDDWGASLSDIVGVRTPSQNNLANGTEDLTVQITDPYEVVMFDDEENSSSCGQVYFGCDEFPGDGDNDPPLPGENFSEFTSEHINQGINDVFPNSRGGDLLCSNDMNTNGYINLIPPPTINLLDFVGYIGLNDGEGRGSMDRFGIVQEPAP